MAPDLDDLDLDPLDLEKLLAMELGLTRLLSYKQARTDTDQTENELHNLKANWYLNPIPNTDPRTYAFYAECTRLEHQHQFLRVVEAVAYDALWI